MQWRPSASYVIVLASYVTASLLAIAPHAAASTPTPFVTFYNDRESFLKALAQPTVLDFEGIASDTGNVSFGKTYHVGQVTFAPYRSSPLTSMIVVGKHSQTLGAPFDSALLIPDTDPGSVIATFDPGSNVTAVGGYFLNAFGNNQSAGGFILSGTNGILDARALPMGIATTGKAKTFFGFTVVGDAITSLSVNDGTNIVAIDDFTYGTAVPLPPALISGALLALAAWPCGTRMVRTAAS